jgi:hypothetical protein
MVFYIGKLLRLVELDECICSKIGDELKVEDIDPELKGSYFRNP